jgi:hypothetical protein
MAATEITAALAEVRDFLVERSARFWSDAELKAVYRLGVNDLWGAILDLHGDHYMVVDEGQSGPGVVLKANATKLSGVPPACFRVLLIEPRDTTSDGVGGSVIFTPRKYNHPDFIAARTLTAQDIGMATEIFYQMSGVGAPIDAPTILTAPKLSTDLELRLAYCPTIDVVDKNPIPGQSDNALKAWTIAYALGKEGAQGQRTPDPGWLGIYATEKQLILTRLTPRQEQEPDTVDDLFGGWGAQS